MARPKKKGLDYFRLDVDIFDDEKLFDVQNEYGPLGEVIYIRLLCLIYKNGYYYKFEDLDKFSAMIIRSIGNRWARDKKTVKEVILYLAKINLFSAELMQRNVITSRSIQERYLTAVERRQSKIEEYNLLEKNGEQEGLLSVPKNQINVTETKVNVAETHINVNDNPTKKRRQKESKVNEMSSSLSAEKIQELLTANEYSHLCEISDRNTVNRYINKIIEWQNKNNKRCKSPFETIRKWIDEDQQKQKSKETSYDLKDFEEYAMNFRLYGDDENN